MKQFIASLGRKRLSVICLVLLLVGLGGYYMHKSRNDYQAYLQKCDNSRQAEYANCLGSQLLGFADTHPAKTGEFLTYIYKNARHLQPVDLRSFSDDSHYAGMLMASKPLSLVQAAQDCGDSFEGGCLHGFVMEKLDDTNVAPGRLFSMTDYCKPLEGSTRRSTQYLNCLHGVGHEIWAKGHTTLDPALSYCDPLRQEYLKNACWSGVFMEYSKTGVSTGHHSHSIVGVVELPCATLSSQYQATCYSAEGSYSQYEPDHETAATSYRYCGTIQPRYSQSCKAAVADRLNLAVGNKLN